MNRADTRLNEEISDFVYNDYLRRSNRSNDFLLRVFIKNPDNGLLRSDLVEEVYANRGDTGDEIPDKIVSVSIATYEGSSLVDTTYICITKPYCNKIVTDRSKLTNRFYNKYANLVDKGYVLPISDDSLRNKMGNNLPPVNMVHCQGGEEWLVQKFIKVMQSINPHIVVTYNGNNFDFKCLIRSAFRYNINLAEQLCVVNPAFCRFKPIQNVRRAKSKIIKHNNTGFIENNILELTYDTFMAFISVDLLLYNSGSLNQVCQDRLKIKKN